MEANGGPSPVAALVVRRGATARNRSTSRPWPKGVSTAIAACLVELFGDRDHEDDRYRAERLVARVSLNIQRVFMDAGRPVRCAGAPRMRRGMWIALVAALVLSGLATTELVRSSAHASGEVTMTGKK